MGTITKALNLLNFFAADRAEVGLSDFTKLAGRDKASVHRHLIELLNAGFLEQDVVTRRYRLGPALLRLAAVREFTFPARSAVAPFVDQLSLEFGELVHVSLLQSGGLSTLYYKDSGAHGTRVYFDEAAILPLHATSSGIAMLALGPTELLQETLQTPRARYTNKTLTAATDLEAAVQFTIETGMAFSDQGFEEEVCSLAVPIFDKHQNATGAIAIAVPLSRMVKLQSDALRDALKSAGKAVTAALGGTVAPAITTLWQSAAG